MAEVTLNGDKAACAKAQRRAGSCMLFVPCPCRHPSGTPKGAKVDARGCWVLRGLHFDTDKAVIQPEYAGILDEVAAVLDKNPGLAIRIDGHTDSDGSEAYNQALSERRAVAVRQALLKRGADGANLEAAGFGEAKPMKPNDTPENKYLNRRVELTAVK